MCLIPLYAGLTRLAAPLLRGRLVRRVGQGKEIAERLGEREGIDPTPRPAGRLVWLHAASVGETISILPVIAALLRTAADVSVLVTTGTVTSATLLASRMGELGPPGRVLHRFVPLDVPAWARRFVDHWRPDVAGFVESEIWPNLLRACARQGIPLMLVNARLSPKSFGLWRRLPGTARRIFGLFAAAQAQTDAVADRLRALGARGVDSPGNLKFATPRLPADAGELTRLGALIGDQPLWLAASTHPGEERIAAAVHQTLAARHPGLLTIIAPRHPERGAEIAAEIAGVSVTRRSLGEDPPETGIWIADTLGELGLLYRLSPIVFVGRSLAVGGGQNPIEPARLGCAVSVGPMTGNFVEAVVTLQAAGALEVVPDAGALGLWVDAMLRDPIRRAAMGAAGMQAASRTAELPLQVATRLLDLAGDPR